MSEHEVDRIYDALRIFCPRAAHRWRYANCVVDDDPVDAFGVLADAFTVLVEHLIEHDKALQSLTPGGSEYVNARDRVVALVKEQQRELHEFRIEQIRRARSEAI